MKLKLAVGETTREVEFQRQGETLTVTDDQGNVKTVQLIHRDEHGLEVEIDGQRIQIFGTKNRDQKHIWANGNSWRYQQIKEGAAGGQADPGSLSVNIPAVVTEVLVSEGDAVKAGDKLVLLESMKMVLSIQAPQDGTVKAIHCEPEQSVEPGLALIELDTE